MPDFSLSKAKLVVVSLVLATSALLGIGIFLGIDWITMVPFIIGGLFTLGSLLLFVAAYQSFKHFMVVRSTKSANLRRPTKGMIKAKGVVKPFSEVLAAPLSENECVFYHTAVTEEDPYGSSKPSKMEFSEAGSKLKGKLSTRISVDTKSVPFVLDDGNGEIIVAPFIDETLAMLPFKTVWSQPWKVSGKKGTYSELQRTNSPEVMSMWCPKDGAGWKESRGISFHPELIGELSELGEVDVLSETEINNQSGWRKLSDRTRFYTEQCIMPGDDICVVGTLSFSPDDNTPVISKGDKEEIFLVSNQLDRGMGSELLKGAAVSFAMGCGVLLLLGVVPIGLSLLFSKM